MSVAQTATWAESFPFASLEAKLKLGLEQANIVLPDAACEKLMVYLALLQKWNKVHNLTAVRDAEEMVTLHLLDSLVILPHVNGERLLDVGSGAGLPGIPLAICLPDLKVTVMDSSQKKASFMRQVKAELNIPNLEVMCGRVEQFKPKEKFDIVVSRAFSEISLFIKLTKHLLKDNGQWLAMKGVYPEGELAQIDAKPSQIVPLSVPGLDAQRHLVFIPFSHLGVV